MTRWGIVATIKAPPREVLNFVAYHLDIGADHLFIFLDNQNPKADAALRDHPQVTVTRTDGAYWRGLGRKKPQRHQPRQTVNASLAYRNASGLDWLLHIDVDEFVCADQPLSDLLGALPANTRCARLFPAEALCTDGVSGLDPKATYCKSLMSRGKVSDSLEHEMFPKFGQYLRGGFVSHHVGKIFVRTGLNDIEFRIHRAFQSGEEVAPQVTLGDVDLCHRHIKDWADWQKTFDYRLQQGSYRAELKPPRPSQSGALSLHDLFSFLISEGGEQALRDFYDEVCLARPDLLDQLAKNDLLRVFHLDLAGRRKKHFPDWRR